MKTNPIKFLAQFFHREKLSLSPREIDSDNPLLTEGIVFDNGDVLDCYGCECGVCQGEEIIPRGDGYAYHCLGTGVLVHLSKEEISLLDVDCDKLVNRIAGLFQCEEPECLVPNTLWRLGYCGFAIGRTRRNIFFLKKFLRNQDILKSIPEGDNSCLISLALAFRSR